MAIKLDGHVHIQSMGDLMVATVPATSNGQTEYVVWEKGSHTANVYTDESAIAFDVFTFAWGKDKASQLDFTLALETHYLCAEPRRIF